MRRTPVIAMATLVFLGVYFLGEATSKLAAEPISATEPAASKSTKDAPAPKELSEAADQFKQRKFDVALTLLKAVVKKNPNLPPAEVIMAQWFSGANIPAGVRGYLEQAVVQEPNDPEAYMLLGALALRERRFTEAELLYQKAQSLMGEFKKSEERKGILQPRILAGLAGIAEVRGDWSGAQKLLEAWLKIDPKSIPAMQQLAACLFHQKNIDGALEKLKEAAKIDPKMLTPEAILAQYCERSGDRENAKKWMIAALKAAPKDANTRLVAAEWALNTGQLEDARTQAAAALQLDPQSLGAKIMRGVVALFEKDYAAAETYFEAAYLQAPGSFAASNNLALSLIEQKDPEKKKRALEYAENNVRKDPRSAEARSTYGWVLYNLNRLDEAEKEFQAAISGGQYTPDTAYFIARLSLDRGRDAQAKEFLESALKSKAPFAMRQEAQALLEKLKK